MTEYYVISVKHTARHDDYITLWGPDDKGYRLRTTTAGRYQEERIKAALGYYNSGYSTIAVPCSIVDARTVLSGPNQFDEPGQFPVLLNTRANWKALLAATIATPKNPCKPEFPGAPRKIHD